mmetsp:Transcript_11157/g.23818  ORF Transcript_11157/g.23818 Transcript_11157/m.23818 type:complete len:259 (-) Transcript_11157:501-1277(-)
MYIRRLCLIFLTVIMLRHIMSLTRTPSTKGIVQYKVPPLRSSLHILADCRITILLLLVPLLVTQKGCNKIFNRTNRHLEIPIGPPKFPQRTSLGIHQTRPVFLRIRRIPMTAERHAVPPQRIPHVVQIGIVKDYSQGRRRVRAGHPSSPQVVRHPRQQFQYVSVARQEDSLRELRAVHADEGVEGTVQEQLFRGTGGLFDVDGDAGYFVLLEGSFAHGKDVGDVQPFSSRFSMCQSDKLPFLYTVDVLVVLTYKTLLN